MGGAAAAIAERYRLMCSQLNERQRRRFAASEARTFGYGGGAAGGGGGAGGRNLLNGRELPPKCRVQLVAGDVLAIETPGGGGWGPPPQR